MTSTRIVDPHVHIWDPRTTPRAVSALIKPLGRFPKILDRATRMLMPTPLVNFVGDPQYVLNAHLPEDFHRDSGKYDVAGFVHVEAGWEEKGPMGPVGETRWLDSIDDGPLAMVAHAALADGDNLAAVLDAHAAASSLLSGIRDMLAAHPAKGVHTWSEAPDGHFDPLTTKEFRAGYELLGERGLTFDAWIYSNQLSDFCRLAQSAPETKVVLDHMATPVGLAGPFGGIGTTEGERDDIKKRWYDDLAEAAALPQVHLKLSGLLMCILGFGFHERGDDSASRASLDEVINGIGPHVAYGIETFGVDRCMFASNFPMDKVSVDYETLYDGFFGIVADLALSADDNQKLFAGTAETFYGLT